MLTRIVKKSGMFIPQYRATKADLWTEFASYQFASGGYEVYKFESRADAETFLQNEND